MELSIVCYCNQLGAGTIDPFTDFLCSIVFLSVLWLALAALAVRFDPKNGRRVGVAVLLAIAIHFVVSEGLLKHALTVLIPMRVRPYLAHPDVILPIGTRFTDSSFPSSHMASTAAVLMVFSIFYPKARVPSLAFLALMAFARMHDGMHYPSDVLTGALLGLAYGGLAVALVRRWEAKARLRGSRA